MREPVILEDEILQHKYAIELLINPEINEDYIISSGLRVLSDWEDTIINGNELSLEALFDARDDFHSTLDEIRVAELIQHLGRKLEQLANQL